MCTVFKYRQACGIVEMYANMWCDQAKSVWSRSYSIFSFLLDCNKHLQNYILQKTPLKLNNQFKRYQQLKSLHNKRKQKEILYFRLLTDFAWSHHINIIIIIYATITWIIYSPTLFYGVIKSVRGLSSTQRKIAQHFKNKQCKTVVKHQTWPENSRKVTFGRFQERGKKRKSA